VGKILVSLVDGEEAQKLVTNMNFVFLVTVRSNSISQARKQKQFILVNKNRICREQGFQKDKIGEMSTELV
jgi:hypothetical protein